MKKSIFSLMIGAIIALTSCSKSDELPTSPHEGDQIATFKVEAPALTRADVNGLTRYIVEAYEGKDLTAKPLRVESTNGTLELTLKKNTDYTFLFWADKGTADANTGYWNAATLKEVKVATGKENTVGEAAYCLMKEFNSKDFETNKAIKLKNATAQVNFIETVGLGSAGNTLKVTYAKGATLNVGTGKVTDVASEMVHTFTGITQVAKDGILATDYVLSPLGEQNVVNLKMQFNTEPEKALTNVPFQQNYKTNIKGEYSNMYASVFTISNEVEDYENNPDVEFPEKLKIGSYYYKDGTWSSTYTADAANPCLGIVFVVNPDGKSGKIVGLDEPIENWNGTNPAGELTWGPYSSTTNAKDELNGLVNMNAVKTAGSGTFTAYPAFAWVHSKNPADTDYSTATKGVWYLPATKELRQLYAAMSGLKWVDSGAVAANGEINDWGNNAEMDKFSNYAAARTAFNGLFTAAGKTTMDLSNYCWSSTEGNGSDAWSVNFNLGYTYNFGKDSNFKVRAVLAF